MVVSYDTAIEIHRAFTRHCTARQVRLILEDLANIPGNRSFRETVLRMQNIHRKWTAGKENVESNRDSSSPGSSDK